MSIDQGIVEEKWCAVVNPEGQYSIWPAGMPLPAGWSDAGKSGSRAECLEYIEHVWVDMRPMSLRRREASQVASGPDASKARE